MNFSNEMDQELAQLLANLQLNHNHPQLTKICKDPLFYGICRLVYVEGIRKGLVKAQEAIEDAR